MVVGWYHSHPGFGCWLSGVDINTQQVIHEHLTLLCCKIVPGFAFCFAFKKKCPKALKTAQSKNVPQLTINFMYTTLTEKKQASFRTSFLLVHRMQGTGEHSSPKKQMFKINLHDQRKILLLKCP